MTSEASAPSTRQSLVLDELTKNLVSQAKANGIPFDANLIPALITALARNDDTSLLTKEWMDRRMRADPSMRALHTGTRC